MTFPAHGYARIRIFLGLALIAFAIGMTGIYLDYRRFADAELNIPNDGTIEIPLGSSFNAIVRIVKSRQLNNDPWFYWRALAWQLGPNATLHAGEYALTGGLTPRELLRRMAVGEVLQHKFTIVEGITFRQLRAALAQESLLQKALAGLSDQAIMAKLDAPDEVAEGGFLPETYAYVKGQSDLDVLRRAHTAMRQALAQLWAKRDSDLPLTSPYQALILASIIERETGRIEERPEIAQVFIRRLRMGMRLQTDPTVIYGLGPQFNGNLTRHDLEADTPFNTYTRIGLPPTPIALPGKAALEAALHPARGNSLYFVARGDGTHEFSDSLEAHNRAVAKYQLHKTP